MSREIKFRGISVKSNKWCVGNLLLINRKAYIYDKDYGDLDDIDFGWGFEEVILDSVGQYTGLKDKNGVEIYEGDVILCEDDVNRVVIFRDGCFGFRGAICEVVHQSQFRMSFFKVIGNIYENPELLS